MVTYPYFLEALSKKFFSRCFSELIEEIHINHEDITTQAIDGHVLDKYIWISDVLKVN